MINRGTLQVYGGAISLAVDFNVLRDFKKIETIVPYINFFFISGEKSILLQFQKWSEWYDNIFNITLAENGSVTYYMGKEQYEESYELWHSTSIISRS